MAKITLTLGFVPSDWSGASDGSKKILVGDVSYSKTSEILYEIGDDDWKNITHNLLLSGSMDDIYKQIGNDCGALSSGLDRIPRQVIQNIYELCLEEAEEQSRFIDLFEDGKDFFLNNRKKYNGCFYCYYRTLDDDEEIETELLFVVKRK